MTASRRGVQLLSLFSHNAGWKALDLACSIKADNRVQKMHVLIHR